MIGRPRRDLVPIDGLRQPDAPALDGGRRRGGEAGARLAREPARAARRRAAQLPAAYYAAAAGAAETDDDGTVLDRITLMRLASALFAAVTAFFTALFVRELVPARALGVGCRRHGRRVPAHARIHRRQREQRQPAVRRLAALLYAIARVLRGGLTIRIAALAGVALAIGLLTKGTILTLLPLACLGLGLAAATSPAWCRASRGQPLRCSP